MNTERINTITETILDNIQEDTLMEILYNVVKYAVEHNNSKTNWTAREIFTDIVSEDLLKQLFDEESFEVNNLCRLNQKKSNFRKSTTDGEN